MNMIKVQGLHKNNQGQGYLKDISFEVIEGECVALIGPNGAGKTTLLDCLLGDKLVTSGQVSIQGLPVTNSQLDYIRGYLPQENVIVQKLKVKELIAFFQSIYPNSLSNQEIDQLLQFGQQQKEQFAEKLSGGQKRLFSFVLTLIGRPKLVFFRRTNCCHGYFNPSTLLGNCSGSKSSGSNHSLFVPLYRRGRAYSGPDFGFE